MFEVFKLVWDLVVLRDVARKGRYNWRIWPMAFGFVLLEYGIGLAAVFLYEKHPEYEPLFIAAMIFIVISSIAFLWWAWRWQTRQAAARKAALNPVATTRQ